MKPSRFVFGIASLVASCAANPHHPLCNRDGSPACGNVGQTGRSDVRTARLLGAPHTELGVSAEVVADELVRPARVVPRQSLQAQPRSRARSLLGPSKTLELMSEPPRPLSGDDPMPGNVMSKGGSRTLR